MSNTDIANAKTRFKAAAIVASIFILILWLVKLVELADGYSYFTAGILPRKLSGLTGIILAPLIHADFNHLINNSISIYILIIGLIYFYSDLWYKIIIESWLISGLMVWLGARSSYHIGCSGIIYAIASFIFFSGVIRRNTSLMAISLLTVFLYGGLIWGVLPIFYQISWEYHLFGGIVGAVLAYVYRNQGPPLYKWSWDETEENDLNNEDDIVDDGLT